MSVFFHLLDLTTGNLVTEFRSEDEAISALNAIQVEEGDQPILDLALFRFHNGQPSLVAKQGELLHYIAHARRGFGDEGAQEESGGSGQNSRASSIATAKIT